MSESHGMVTWIAKLEARLEKLWKLVNGNGEVGVFEAIREMGSSMETMNEHMEALHAKVDTLARRDDLDRLRSEFDSHIRAEHTLLKTLDGLAKLRPVWRWLAAIAASAVSGGAIGAWLK